MESKRDKRLYCAFPGCGKALPKPGGYYCGGHVIWPQNAEPEPPPKDSTRKPEAKGKDKPKAPKK